MINLSNSAAHDIDFAIWGPFATQAAMCAGTTNAPLDCSYDPAATEQVDIPNAVAGQWYMMLITNYANTPTNISAIAGNATGTDGTTNCNILCNMTALYCYTWRLCPRNWTLRCYWSNYFELSTNLRNTYNI
jgi:hypothetical protein